MLNENHVVEWERNRPFHLPHRFQTRDWWKALRSTLSSDVIQGIGQPVLAVTLFSLAVALLYRFFPALPSLSFKLGALSPHSLVAPALSLLLVFRTNAAYSHFWEGRQLLVHNGMSEWRRGAALTPLSCLVSPAEQP